MKNKDTLVILSPGFPGSEADTSCIAPQQVFVKTVKELYPSLEIIIIAFQYPFNKKEYFWHGTKVIAFNGRNRGGVSRITLWLKIFTELKRLRRKYNITGILGFWMGECALVGKYFAKWNGIPHFTWILGQDARKDNKYFSIVRPHSRSLIALSDGVAFNTYLNYRVRPGYIIPVGIDTRMYPGDYPKRDIAILGAGSLIPLKRYDILIELVKELREDLPHIKAVICGMGAEKEKLQALINKEGLEDNITLVGEVSHKDVIAYMQRTQVFLHPSSYEGFGAVCAEGLFAGCHVISFVQPVFEPVKHWHIVNSKTEMLNKTLELLKDPGTCHEPVLYQSAASTAKSVMDLFGY